MEDNIASAFKIEFLSKYRSIEKSVDFDLITLPETRRVLFDFISAHIATDGKLTKNILSFDLYMDFVKKAINLRVSIKEISDMRMRVLGEKEEAADGDDCILAIIAMTLGSGEWKDYDLGAGECFSIFAWYLFKTEKSLAGIFLDFLKKHPLINGYAI